MALVPDLIVIATRFRGPLTSGNGGYAAGLLAEHVDAAAVEVTLRLPPPLERPLRVRPSGDGVVLLDADAVVAEAHPAWLELDFAGTALLGADGEPLAAARQVWVVPRT